MPNRKTHASVGAAVGIGASIAIVSLGSKEIVPTTLFDGAQTGGHYAAFIALGTFFGWLGGLLPDLLEPSNKNPHHRKFFHSVVVLIALTGFEILIYMGHILSKHSQESYYLRTITFFFILGYLSHLLLDSMTSQGLPWIKS